MTSLRRTSSVNLPTSILEPSSPVTSGELSPESTVVLLSPSVSGLTLVTTN